MFPLREKRDLIRMEEEEERGEGREEERGEGREEERGERREEEERERGGENCFLTWPSNDT